MPRVLVFFFFMSLGMFLCDILDHYYSLAESFGVSKLGLTIGFCLSDCIGVGV